MSSADYCINYGWENIFIRLNDGPIVELETSIDSVYKGCGNENKKLRPTIRNIWKQLLYF